MIAVLLVLLSGVPADPGTLWSGSADVAESAPNAIIDTHIHFYQVTREGGVPWPPRGNRILYRDVLPDDYKRVAQPLGIDGLYVGSPSDQRPRTADLLIEQKQTASAPTRENSCRPEAL